MLMVEIFTRMVQIHHFFNGTIIDYWFYNRLTIISTWYDMIWYDMIWYMYIYVCILWYIYNHETHQISWWCLPTFHQHVILRPSLMLSQNWTEHCTAHSYIYIIIYYVNSAHSWLDLHHQKTICVWHIADLNDEWSCWMVF